MAPAGPTAPDWRCPLLGVIRKWRFVAVRTGFDPFRTFGPSPRAACHALMREAQFPLLWGILWPGSAWNGDWQQYWRQTSPVLAVGGAVMKHARLPICNS